LQTYYQVAFVLFVSLYAAKALALGRCRRHATAVAVFVAALAVVVPLTWLNSPFWSDHGVERKAIFIGEPLSTLLIPTLSFLWDWTSPRLRGITPAWLWRLPLEMLVAALWFVFWSLVELVLGWTYI